MHSEFQRLEQEIKSQFPSAKPKATLFPSGAAMLDVEIGNETYVLEYHLNVGLGINRRSTAVFGWEGYERVFDDFPSAEDYLMSLLRSGRS